MSCATLSTSRSFGCVHFPRSMAAMSDATARKGSADESRGPAKRQMTMPALGAILFAAQAVQGAIQSGLNALSFLVSTRTQIALVIQPAESLLLQAHQPPSKKSHARERSVKLRNVT